MRIARCRLKTVDTILDKTQRVAYSNVTKLN